MPAFDRSSAKIGALQVKEAKRLRELEAANLKLNKLLAEAHLRGDELKVPYG